MGPDLDILLAHFTKLLRHRRLQTLGFLLRRVHTACHFSQSLLESLKCLDTLSKQLFEVLRVVMTAVVRCHVLEKCLKRLDGQVFITTLFELELV